MKNPKLKFQQVYIVEEWSTEIKEGIGIYFKELKEYLISYSNCWLVWVENSEVPERFYSSKVFVDYDKAFNQLQIEKKDYIKYLEQEVEENILKLKSLNHNA